MFKMLSFGLDAGFQSFSPLVNGIIHNCLFQVSPYLNKSLLQFSQITNRRPVTMRGTWGFLRTP